MNVYVRECVCERLKEKEIWRECVCVCVPVNVCVLLALLLRP